MGHHLGWAGLSSVGIENSQNQLSLPFLPDLALLTKSVRDILGLKQGKPRLPPLQTLWAPALLVHAGSSWPFPSAHTVPSPLTPVWLYSYQVPLLAWVLLRRDEFDHF